MFVSADQLAAGLPAVGEEVNFEVTLTDDFRLVHGRGEVAWVRASTDSEGEAGAAVRFLDLDEPSRRLVSRLLTNYAKDGGRPFAIAPAGAAKESAVEPEPLARSEADELFTAAPDLLVSKPEVLDAVVPQEPQEQEAALPPFGDFADQDVIPTLELDVDELKTDESEVFDLPTLSAAEILKAEAGKAEATPLARQADLGGSGRPDSETAASPGGLDLGESLPISEARPVISEDIAQIAEELSGSGVHEVQPVEMPSEEDQISLAGAGRVSERRPAWRTPLFASLAGIALAVAAWYFAGDLIKGGLIGFGDGGGEAAAVVARAGETTDAPRPDAPGADTSGADTSGPEPMPETETSAAAEFEPTGETASETAREQETPAPSPVAAAPDPKPESEAVSELPLQAAVREAAVVTSSSISTVEGISWETRGGETVVSIVVDGATTDDVYEIVRIRQGAPREVIKIFGVDKPYSPKRLDVGSAQVRALRTGVHSNADGSEIHIVADLAGPAVAVTLVRTEGNTILVTFS
jgi:hypothetical protein